MMAAADPYRNSVHVPPASATGDWTLADAAVVDPATDEVTAHQDVRISSGRIAEVTAHDPSRGSVPGDLRIDARGRFLSPGYIDGHAHALNHPDDVAGAYALMLANGVVGYRQMSGSDELLERRAAGTLPEPPGAPRLLALPGALLTPITAPDILGAAEQVRHQARAGADFIKAGFTNRWTFLSALETAHEVGLPLSGHLPNDLDPRDASRFGTRCFEHLGTGTSMFAVCSTQEKEVTALTKPVPSFPTIPGLPAIADRLFMPILLTMVVNPAAKTSASVAEAYRLADSTFDESKARALADLLCEDRTWQCFTLIRLHTQQFPDQHRDDSRLAYMAPEQVERWRASAEELDSQEPWILEALSQHWDAQLRLARVLADAGVPMITGTDSDDAGWIIPGFALHDEFDLLADAGIGALEILRAATSAAAEFFGREDVAGRVAPGYEADLVLLGGDPTASVEAMHDIRGVIRAGQLWDRTALDVLLARARETPSAL